jgi:hypothetical protein
VRYLPFTIHHSKEKSVFTIADLKTAIANLPDGMPVILYDDGNTLPIVRVNTYKSNVPDNDEPEYFVLWIE